MDQDKPDKEHLLLNDLPPELLTHIFQCLPLNSIKVCRLVNHKWYECCQTNAIRKYEKHRFHSGLISTYEMKTFLDKQSQSSCIKVHFVKLALDELSFQTFGKNISDLLLEECTIKSIERIKILFSFSPNLRTFRCVHLIINCDQSRFEHFSVVTLQNVFNMLIEENFQNENLEAFGFAFNDGYPSEVPSLLQKLFQVFPSVNSIDFYHTSPSVVLITEVLYWSLIAPPDDQGGTIIDLIKIAERNIGLIKSNIQRLARCYINFNDICSNTCPNVVVPLPKFDALKYLYICLILDSEQQYLNSCLDFFSQQTELEELVVTFKHAAKDDQGTIGSKILLFHILRTCTNLKTLSYEYLSDRMLYMDQPIAEEFIQLICGSNLKTLRIQNIEIRASSMRQADNRQLNSLEHLQVHLPTSTPRVLIEESNLKHLTMTLASRFIEHRSSPVHNRLNRLVEIIEDQENLQSLELYLPERIEPRILSWRGIIQHTNLAVLKIRILQENKIVFDNVINFLDSCEFQNLSAFVLTLPANSMLMSGRCTTLKKRLCTWLEKWHTLKLLLFINVTLSFDECIQVCSGKNELQDVSWTTKEPVEHEKIVKLFTLCPALNHLSILINNTSNSDNVSTYFYRRSKRQLFQSTLANPTYRVVYNVDSGST